MIERYLNYDHGLELYPDINKSHRGNENGIVFLVEYFILKEMSGEELTEQDELIFREIVDGLEVMPGLYDRGHLDSQRENPKRSISHDNLSAISSGSRLFKTEHEQEIATYGLKNFFVYNNNQKGFDVPMNPGNYPIWLANTKLALPLVIFFLLFYFPNFIITNVKFKKHTTGRLLNIVELYPLRKHFFWGKIYKLNMYLLSLKYENLAELFSIYFKDENHPINILARKL